MADRTEAMDPTCDDRSDGLADPAAIADALASWFDDAARPLPWRTERTPWRALVSEAMLQQTQVARVVEKFEPFLERFPTPRALAEADEEAVLAAWSGLGYYRRARHLQAAARAIVERHDGEVPHAVEDLLALPGVGRYTAGAIASIVFGAPAPIVDGNVVRVLMRLAAREGAPDARDTVAWCWREAERLARAAERPGVANEAMMELGATVCTPSSPDCAGCPLRQACAAHAADRTDDIPPPKRRATRRVVHHHAVVITIEDDVVLERRGARGLWSGMFQPPTVEADDPVEPADLRALLPVDPGDLRVTATFTHVTTHREVRFRVHEAIDPTVDEADLRAAAWRRVGRAELDDVPMGNPHRRLLGLA